MMPSRLYLLTLVAVGLVACGGRGSDSADADAAASGIPGYVHTLAHSRFQIGPILREEDQWGMHKVVGQGGTFATWIVSGGVTAVHNGDIFVLTGSTQGEDPATEGRTLVDYLVGAGLPADQVGPVREDGAVALVPIRRISFEIPILSRVYQGIPIDDSTAWAFLNRDGESFAELVYWPAIDADVLEAAKALKMGAAFVAPSGAEVTLVIHHTPWYWQGTFVAIACYRAKFATGTTYLDGTGHIVTLPSDLEAPPVGSVIHAP